MRGAVLSLRSGRATLAVAWALAALAGCRPWGSYVLLDDDARSDAAPRDEAAGSDAPVDDDASDAALAEAGDGALDAVAEAGPDVALDALAEAGPDGALDAGFDAPRDAGFDAAADAGPTWPGWQRVTIGGGTVCALWSSGRVYCWGRNDLGQAGPYEAPPSDPAGSVFERPVSTGAATRIALSVSAQDVSCAHNGCCALGVDGSVWCWGEPGDGLHSGAGPTNTPTRVALPGGAPARQVVVFSPGAIPASACAVDTNNVAYCWGRNGAGQLGLAPPAGASATPREVLRNVVQLAAASRTVYARRENGSVYSWGGNSLGQLGRATSTAAPGHTPSPVSLAAGPAAELFAGHDGVCVRHADNAYTCWGDGSMGRLTNAVSTELEGPVVAPSPAPALAGYARVCLGERFGCGVDGRNQVHCWGQTSTGLLRSTVAHGFTPTPELAPSSLTTPVVQVSCGSHTACRIRTDGSLACWGDNTFGQVTVSRGGRPDRMVGPHLAGLPEQVTTLPTSPAPSAIAAGDGFTCALVGGRVRCFGRNEAGEQRLGVWEYPMLGSGSAGINGSGPPSVSAPSPPTWPRFDQPTTALSAGPASVCARFAAADMATGSEAACVGLASALGYAPVASSTVGRYGLAFATGSILSVSAGYQASCALFDGASRTVRCVGATTALGATVTPEALSAAPANSFVRPMATLVGISRIEAQMYRAAQVFLANGTSAAPPAGEARGHGCVIATSAMMAGASPRLYCWGADGFQQLGLGASAVIEPSTVTGTGVGRSLRAAYRANGIAPEGAGDVLSVALGTRHTCAAFGSSVVRCAGHAAFGQLGPIDSDELRQGNVVRFDPPLGAGNAIVEVVAGAWHTCARSANGSVYCWGSNTFGQLGYAASTVVRAAPTLVAGLPPSRQLAAGALHTCSLGVDGRVFCWGSGHYGENGRNAPVRPQAMAYTVPAPE